jgi:hypothetical protein
MFNISCRLFVLLKGQKREMIFSLIASYLGQKEMILNFVHVVLIFTGLGQDLTHLAHKKSTHSEMFQFGRLKILIVSCFLTALI